MIKGKLIIHPEGTPLPPDHPFATTRIFVGVKRQDFYGENAPEQKEATPTSGEAISEPTTIDMSDPAWMKKTQDMIDQKLNALRAAKQKDTGTLPKTR